jgi:hypothetical protein
MPMPPLLHPRKETWYPFYRRVGGLGTWSLRGYEHQTIQPAASHYTYYTATTTAFHLHSTPCETQTSVSNSKDFCIRPTHFPSQNIRTVHCLHSTTAAAQTSRMAILLNTRNSLLWLTLLFLGSVFHHYHSHFDYYVMCSTTCTELLWMQNLLNAIQVLEFSIILPVPPPQNKIVYMFHLFQSIIQCNEASL